MNFIAVYVDIVPRIMLEQLSGRASMKRRIKEEGKGRGEKEREENKGMRKKYTSVGIDLP